MKNLLNRIFFALMPFIMATAFIVLFVFGVVFSFYFFFWVFCAGVILYLLVWIYSLFFLKGPRPNLDENIYPHQAPKKEGRIFDHDQKND